MHTCNIVGVLVPVNTCFISNGRKKDGHWTGEQIPGPMQVLGLLQVLLHPDETIQQVFSYTSSWKIWPQLSGAVPAACPQVSREAGAASGEPLLLSLGLLLSLLPLFWLSTSPGVSICLEGEFSVVRIQMNSFNWENILLGSKPEFQRGMCGCGGRSYVFFNV